MMGGQSGGMPYGNPWMLMPQTADAGPREDSLARASRRQKRKEYDAGAMSRTTGGHRPNKLRVKDGGDIDGGCPGKNAWDDVIRSLVPRILDISVIEWEAQKAVVVEKLREALDVDFEYVPVTLSQRGFRNAIKHFMKTERSRLKAQYMAGNITCPVHIDPRQWQRLQEYWGSNLQREKAEKMTIARKQVKNIGNVGRKGKDGKEAAVVSACLLNAVLHYLRVVIFHSRCMYIWDVLRSMFKYLAQRRNRNISPGLTEIAEGLQASEEDGHGTSVCPSPCICIICNCMCAEWSSCNTICMK
jgi:hypothetical protein